MNPPRTNNFAGRMKLTQRFSTCLGATAFLLGLFLLPLAPRAQEQQQGLCAQIKIVISQQVTLERVGFLATLTITDNDPTDPLTDFSANLKFENPQQSTNGVVNDSSTNFFVQPPQLQNISDVNGGGVIAPGATATISWFIIPTASAGGQSPNGMLYNLGATLSGKIKGVTLPPTSLLVIPASFSVYPDAQLQITYFQPRDVMADNPFTPQVESPIPFTFGVLVQNVGYGPAHNVVIQSQQPQITENKQNLLIVAQLLGSRVNDSALSNANLTVNVGDLNPGQTSKGAWDMITTLSGTFLSVAATYQHSTALGGQETSLIKSVKAYLFLHEVMDDQPGRDKVRDFLADTSGAMDSINNLIPDSLYESEGYVFPVNYLTNASVVGSSSPFQVNLAANFNGWGYLRVNDPGQATLPISSVVRSDGKVLNSNNYWTSIHYEPGSNFKDTYLNILDLVNLGNYTYTVKYAPRIVSTVPPVTTLLFAGPSTYTNGIYYVTPDTQMYFISQDSVPVSIVYSLTNGPFVPALPFNLTIPGTYQLSYSASDANGNQETNHSATLVVAGANSLGFGNVIVPSSPIFVAGGAASVRPGSVPISFQAQPNPTPLNAQVDIFSGVVAWATVSNTPSSPTSSTSASLNVGGNNVDYYIYRLNSGSWSAEQAVSTPLALSSLSAGSNNVAVLGRSRYGTYLNASNALSVGWVVDPAAPATTITGAPATPTQSISGRLNVGGSGVSGYQWTLNNSYYQAPSNIVSPIVLSNLSIGQQLVNVLGISGGVTQATNKPTSVSWTINPLYGYDLTALTNLTSVAFTNIGSGVVTYNWNGRSAAGVVQPPGWYTVRVTLSDPLGHTNFATGLAQIGSLAGTNVVLAGANRGPQNPYARGKWAVWQDQSTGNSQIYAQNIGTSNSPIVQVTSNTFSQQNPKTDGRYLVWQGQQANGSWDVYLEDLNGSAGPQVITSTSGLDEINPTIDWPWIVYQTRQTGLGTSPSQFGNTNTTWQLYATNLVTAANFAVSPSVQDEISPNVQAGRVAWQDLRNPGAGEIYFRNLETGQSQRVTTNLFGKYNPAIYNNWIVWQDARNTELDLYGYDFLRQKEVRLTSSPEDESQPYINGEWVACVENSLAPQAGNIRLVHLPSLLTVPVTRSMTQKALPVLADGFAIWQETVNGQASISSVALPSLQGVFQNRNVIAVTPAMVAYATNTFGLLSAWATNGVQAVTEYTSLVPQVTSQTASLSNGVPSGANLSLVPGSFLWVKFNSPQVLDLGVNNSSPLNFATGANVFGYTGFPDAYSAFQLLRQIGLNNALSVRMLDAQSGRWRVAEVHNGGPSGDDFYIPNVAVLMVSVVNPVSQFVPQSQ